MKKYSLVILFAVIFFGCDEDSNYPYPEEIKSGWAQQFQSEYPHGEITSIYFLNDSVGWAASYKEVYATRDGGKNWKMNTVADEDDGSNYAIKASTFFLDETHGWLATEWGKIFFSADGGKNWKLQYSQGVYRPLYNIKFITNETGYASGSGYLLKTRDGGQTWENIARNITTAEFALEYMDAIGDNIWVSGRKDKDLDQGFIFVTTMYHSKDAGITWDSTDLYDNSTVDDERIFSIHFIDESTGWIAGDKIRSTHDGGKTWEISQSASQFKPMSYSEYKDIFFSDNLHGWAVGPQDIYLYTKDGGTTWKAERSPGAYIYAVHFVNDSTGWLVDWGGIKSTRTGGIPVK